MRRLFIGEKWPKSTTIIVVQVLHFSTFFDSVNGFWKDFQFRRVTFLYFFKKVKNTPYRRFLKTCRRNGKLPYQDRACVMLSSILRSCVWASWTCESVHFLQKPAQKACFLEFWKILQISFSKLSILSKSVEKTQKSWKL